MKKNKFCVISPMWNASKTLPRMLHSITGQSYDYWKLILVDDVSEREHLERNVEVLQTFQDLEVEHEDRINVIWNSEKKWEIENVLQALKFCDDDDIIVRVDADDFITDLDAFRIINEVYNQTNCDMLWTNHRWHSNERITFQNISAPFTHGSDPYKHPWVSSHLRTHRKYLLNNVKDENYRDSNGKYFKRIGDQTFALPALKNSKHNVHLPLVMYSYFCPMNPENFQTEDARYQRDEALYLRNRGYIE